MRVIDGAPAFIRRARGFVPEPIDLGADGPCLIAAGADLKNTVTVTRGREAFISQHIGDLDNREAIRFRDETIGHLTSILGVRPEGVACDLHPDFTSTRAAEAMGLPLLRVQHHVAHVAAVVAEHGLHGRRARRRARRPRLWRGRRRPGAANFSRSTARNGSASAISSRWRCPAATAPRASPGAWGLRCSRGSADSTPAAGFFAAIPQADALAKRLGAGAPPSRNDEPGAAVRRGFGARGRLPFISGTRVRPRWSSRLWSARRMLARRRLAPSRGAARHGAA